MDIVVFALTALTLVFALISLALPLGQATRLPLPVILSIAGIGLGTAVSVGGVALPGLMLDAYDQWFLESLALDGQALLLVFLPPLLFEMALAVNVRRLVQDAGAVVLLAVVAVVLATGLVGLALWSASALPLVACLLLGAAISTTDPAAVVTTFREIGAPRRLLAILEGESLLNDAAAIALFTLLIGVAGASAEAQASPVALTFLYSFGAGALTGTATAWAASRLYRILGGSPVAEVTLTVALAYGSFLLAERLTGASGVVSVVFAGMTTTAVGIVRMGPRNWATVVAVWAQIGFWANALILLIAATLAPAMLLALQRSELLLLAIVFVAAFFARAVVLFLLLPLLSRVGLMTSITNPQKMLVWWGGVRGAVTLILAFALSELPVLGAEERRLLPALGAGFVFLTLLLNASTLRILTRLVGADRLSPSEQALRERIVAGAMEDARRQVETLATERAIEPEIAEEMQQAYEAEIRSSVEEAESTRIAFGERLRLGLAILCNEERRLVRRGFEEGAIGPQLTQALRAGAERLAEAARTGGRAGYEAAMRAELGFTFGLRLALFLQRRLRFDRWLRRRLARRVALLLESETYVRALSRFVEDTLPSMIGADAAANLEELIEKRLALLREAIAAIHLQYPSYTEATERILLLGAAVRAERARYDTLFRDGIIAPELHRALLRDLKRRERALEQTPRLDLGLSPQALLAQVPLFDALEPAQKKRIARRLRARIALPGEVVARAGERGTAMVFIVSGALEVRGLAAPVRLSNGDVFGELALLAPYRRRRTDVVALTYCRLLTLTRPDYRRLVERDPALGRAIAEAAEARLRARTSAQPEEEMDWRMRDDAPAEVPDAEVETTEVRRIAQA